MGKRIRKAVNYIVFTENLVNQRDVADLIGRNKDNMSKALSGDMSYTNIYIDAICEKYKMFNKDWLLSGEGDMMPNTPPITDSPTTDRDIKILDIRVCAGHGVGLGGDENHVVGYVNIPDFTGCYGITVYGDSMYDKYMSGDTIFVREIKDKSLIDNGQPYVIITNEERLLKMVYVEDQGLKLVSFNPMCNPDGRRRYPDMEIEGNQILHLYKVVGKLARTQM